MGIQSFSQKTTLERGDAAAESTAFAASTPSVGSSLLEASPSFEANASFATASVNLLTFIPGNVVNRIVLAYVNAFNTVANEKYSCLSERGLLYPELGFKGN